MPGRNIESEGVLDGFEHYPANSENPGFIKPVLEIYHQRLIEQSPRLFVNSDELCSDNSLLLRDYNEEKKGFDNQDIISLTQLRTIFEKHIQEGKEPQCRYAFIEAANSRSPLECNLAMFQLLCRYYQISPGFLDLLYSFGTQWEQSDFYHTYFFDESLQGPKIPMGTQTTLPQRSNFEIRMCYKLQAIELGDDGKSWSPRHTAIYHSFDLHDGKAFWLAVKANDEISHRLNSMTDKIVNSGPESGPTRVSSFADSLRAHLVILEWSTEGWRWFIRETEERLRSTFEKVKLTQVHANDASNLTNLTRSDTFHPKINTGGTFNSNFSHYRLSKGLSFLSRQGTNQPGGIITNGQTDQQNASIPLGSLPDQVSPSSSRGSKKRGATQKPVDETVEDNDEKLQRIRENVKRLKNFTIEEMQKLNHDSSTLHGYKLSIGLNARIISDIRNRYQLLYHSQDLPDDIKSGCRGEIEDFERRTRRLERLFEDERLRIDTLITLVDDSKRLYELMLQFHSSEVNNLFAISNNNISNYMRQLAEKTERDTSSMHVITIFTLIFLPGTFLAVRWGLPAALHISKYIGAYLTSWYQSFFSTPIFNAEGKWSWSTNVGLLRLFMGIGIPLTVVTFLVWGAMAWRQKRRQPLQDEEATGSG